MSTVSASSLYANTTDMSGVDNARTPSATLDQEDFLKLLVTKMSSQDPMNPQGDEEFISQMAQFTALEQSKSMRNDIAALTANNMIGRTVSVKEESLGGGNYDPGTEGAVTGIHFNEGSPEVIIGGKSYALNRVTSINPYVEEITVPTIGNPLQAPGVLPSISPLQALSMLQA